MIASLRRRLVKYAGGRRPAFQLDITDAESIRAFSGEIGIFGKEAALAKVRAALARKRYQTNRDLIPAAVWRHIDAARQGATWRAVGLRLGLTDNSNLHVGRRALSRRRLAAFARALGDARLADLATSDVYWDEIVSIEPKGLGRVYDLTIPGTHNFVANDVCVHNTAFCLNIAEHAALRSDVGVAIFSLEMAKEQLAMRMLCSEARVDLARVRTGHLSDREFPKLAMAAGRLGDAPIYIDDTPALSVLELRAKARRLKRDAAAKLGLVIVDYIQLMRSSEGKDNREQEISEISRSLKALAKELGVPVVALSQLNRQVESRTPPVPRLADLRESGAIEQDADVICFLYRDEYYNPEDSEKQGLQPRGQREAGRRRGAHRQAAQRPHRQDRADLPEGVHALRESRGGARARDGRRHGLGAALNLSCRAMPRGSRTWPSASITVPFACPVVMEPPGARDGRARRVPRPRGRARAPARRSWRPRRRPRPAPPPPSRA